MGLDQYILQKFFVLDPTMLTQQQKNHLINVFDKNAKTKLPSIIEQLRTKNLVRKEIDKALLQSLEIKGDYDEILDSAYRAIADIIKSLAIIMKEGRIEE